MRLQHVAALVFDQPLMIEPVKGGIIARYLAARMRDGLMPQALVGEVRPARRERLQIENGVAILDITGIMVNRAGQMTADSAPLLSYEQLTSELEGAIADPSVRGILLRLDSPGGEVAGVFDLAARIRQASAQVPIWAIAAAQATSAAYLLGSAAQRFFVTQEAVTGSIGVVLARWDVTKALEAEGVRLIQIASGARKLDGSPSEPWEPGSDEDKALRAFVGRHYELFVRAVSNYRGITAEAVRATDAGLFVGRAAVAAGLADDVSTIRGTLEALIAQTRTSDRSVIMSAPTSGTPAPAPAAAAATTQAGPTADAIAGARLEGAKAEQERIRKLEALTPPGCEQQLAAAKADPALTPEAYAVQILGAQQERRRGALAAMRGDEAALERPEPLGGGADGATGEQHAVRETLQLFYAARGQKAPAK